MKSHFCTKLLAVAAIVVLWIPVCSPILSSQEWIDASQEILQDSTNQLVIKKIPNAACDKLSQTRGSGCHPSDATRLAQWFFSLKCIIQCNQGFGLPLEVIHDVEVNCQFSETNTLNMTMGEIEWSAECHCPVGLIHSGSNFTIEVVSYSLMADEYSKMKCDDPGASADTVASLTKYNEKGFTSCRETPSICDRHATCVDDDCVCAPGYTGSGLDCFYQCKIPSIERALVFENSNGIILSEGDLIGESENLTVTCDQLDRKMFNLTCGCDGFDNMRTCEKAVYLTGGFSRENWLDSIAVFYPEAPFKSYVSLIKLTTPRELHVTYLMKNGSLITINGYSRVVPAAVEMFNPASKKWVETNSLSTGVYGQFLHEINDQLYVCGGRISYTIYSADCFWISLDTALITNSYQMQAAQYALCSFVIDNNIYAVGGHTISGVFISATMLNLTAASPAWQTINTYPADIFACGAAAYAGLGYVCGGRLVDSDIEIDACNSYDPTFDTWTTIESMIENRGYFSMIQLDGVLYSILGSTGGGFSSTVEYYNITGDRKWTLIPGMDELLQARYAYSVAYSWN